MKIYHEESDLVDDVENGANDLLSNITEPYLSLIKPLVEGLKKTNTEKLYYFNEAEKYKLMWRLRSLESEINKEGGIFILTKEGGLQIKDFSTELLNEIKKVLHQS
ncbi:MAG: hypothetical protein IPN39_04825 [Chitinophagaceae bacterium]|nr:hypothetical protein [Chitinophagaceae bacterium]